MGDAATPTLPNFTNQTASVYKANIDAGFAVADRLAWAFAPHQQDQGSPVPDMTVRLESGAIFNGTALTEVAAQSTSVLTAPSTNPRIDRVVIDRAGGSVSVVTGSEAASPTPPSIPAGKLPVAQVLLNVGQTEIVDSDITDERALDLLGHAITTRGDLIVGDANGNPGRLGVGASDQVLVSDGSDVTWGAAPGIPSGTKMLFQQTAAPTGWTKDTTHNNKALRIVSGTAGSGGATGFTSVFGASKTTGNRTLTSSQIAAHSHTQRIDDDAGNAQTQSRSSATASPSKYGAHVTANLNAIATTLTTASAGGGSSHNHSLSLDLQYVDVIIASKD